MAKEKNKRENHTTKRGTYGYGYGPKETADGGRGGQRSGRGGSAGRDDRRREFAATDRKGRDAGFSSMDRKDRHAAFSSERRKPEQAAADFGQMPGNVIVGRNPVAEALKSGREIDKLVVSATEGSMIKILAQAKEKGIPVMKVEKAALDRLAQGQAHQGVAAYISPYAYSELEDIFALAEARGEEPFLLILDNLEDPHNLGAIMRSAECAGAHGIVIPKRRACGLTEIVAKASAGAIEYMPCVKVTNIAQTIDELKARGIWVAACDMGGQNYYEADLGGKLAVVIGSEGFGISKLVRDKCDFIVSMPMVGKITSLNASNAAAVILYEVRRQRDQRHE